MFILLRKCRNNKDIYLECDNAKQIWYETENWMKTIHDCHFKIADIEKILGTHDNDEVKHLIIISIKDEIYTKRKTGRKMELNNVNRFLLKN